MSVVRHADLQGPTQVDSDDEPMVDGRSTLWLHADSTVIDSAQPTPSILARNPGLPRHIRSDLAATQVDVSCDDELLIPIANSEPCATVAASPGALRAAGVVSEGGVTANRFSLGTEPDSDSSTEEFCMTRRRPSRLVLVSLNVPVTEGPIEMEVYTVSPVPTNPPDSHELRYRRVRQAMQRGRHKWSVLNGPLLEWAAAEDTRCTPVLGLNWPKESRM